VTQSKKKRNLIIIWVTGGRIYVRIKKKKKKKKLLKECLQVLWLYL